MRAHHRHIRGRYLLAASLGLAAALAPARARAQAVDVYKPNPNVLILLDTAGSMEYMMDGTTVESSPTSKCPTTVTSTTTTTANRWGVEVQALTGNFSTYTCMDMSRASNSAFETEFGYWNGSPPAPWGAGTGTDPTKVSGGTYPYDLNYYIDFHRPVSPNADGTVCAVGFNQRQWSLGATSSHTWLYGNTGTDFANAFSPSAGLVSAGVQGFKYDPSTGKICQGQAGVCAGTPSTLGTGSLCTISQSANGLVDQGGANMRFALMTLDSDTNPRTGVTVSGSSPNMSFNQTLNPAAALSDDPPAAATSLATGLWSYFAGWTTGLTTASQGRPSGCTLGLSTGPYPYYEVGARNPYAPPWEGPLVPFQPTTTATPDPNPTTINNYVQEAILAMRPYGANPIAGLMDDAKYYYWKDPNGPAGTVGGSAFDVLGGCRSNYIILLTHAAPNLDLTPYCEGAGAGGDAGSSSSVGKCPYDAPENIAAGLYAGSYNPSNGIPNAGSAAYSGNPVKTFVVGFSLSSGLSGGGSCTDILTGTAPNYTGYDSSKCGSAGQSVPAAYSKYATCCELAKIASAGGTNFPYFADNQSDLNAALAAVLDVINGQSYTTRAVPVELGQTSNSYTGTTQTGATAALFVSSFSPSKGQAWSGDVQRERYQCTWQGGTWAQQLQTVDPNNTAGDDFAKNLDTNQGATRYVLLAYPNNTAGVTPSGLAPAQGSQSVLRPWVWQSGAVAYDGLPLADTTEYMFSYVDTGNSSPVPTGTFKFDALFNSGNCPAIEPCTTGTRFPDVDCENLAFGFALGVQNGPSSWPTSCELYPARYYGSLLAGGNTSTVSALGGVWHSTPAISTAPSALLQDDSFQDFITHYANSAQYEQSSSGVAEPRHSVLYVATIDGLLHAFGVDYDPNDTYTYNGNQQTQGKMNEMWSFIPPAVMPHLLDSFPSAQLPLLDGSPVVADTVYDRAQVGTFSDWHTTLVSGTGGPGSIGLGTYFALDVTDPVMQDSSGAGVHHASSGIAIAADHSGSVSHSTHAYQDNCSLSDASGHYSCGPHFLWQVGGGLDPTTDKKNQLGYLFGKYTSTPAIATILLKESGGTNHEVGVAFLPGGTDSATPTGGATSGPCSRYTAAGGSPVAYDSSKGFAPNPVRQWGSAACTPGTPPTAQVKGRSLTVVRLDTGEIIRTFANLPETANDLPLASTIPQFPLYAQSSPSGQSCTTVNLPNGGGHFDCIGRVTNALFDSPITGVPVPYPSGPGAIAQRVFVADADGAIWRVDLSDPESANWYVELFWDSFNTKVAGNLTTANQVTRQPIVDQPRVSVGRLGNVVINYGTGDTSTLGTNSGGTNYVFSIRERANSNNAVLSDANWWYQLPHAGELVTGPSAVFDAVYYFTTYAPAATSGFSCAFGDSYFWGMDYEGATDTQGEDCFSPAVCTVSTPSLGGAPELVPNSTYAGNSSSSATPCGISNAAGTQYQCLDVGVPSSGGSSNQSPILPGVSITSTAACSQATQTTDQYTGQTRWDISNVQQASYSVSALTGAAPGAAAGTGAAKVGQISQKLQNPRVAAVVDSWAAVVE
jgi:type IV pilus assembly protein PilY1